MNIQHHKIGRLVLELDTGCLADADSLQETVGTLWHTQGRSRLAAVFDRLVGAERVVRLDRLEIELAELDAQSVEDEFVPQLVLAVERQLGDCLSGDWVGGDRAQPLAQSPAAADAEALFYFLQYGRLPWWRTAQNWADWLPRWEAILQAETGWQSTLRDLLQQARVRRRLIDQLPEHFCRQVVEQLQPSWQGWDALLDWMVQLSQQLDMGARVSKNLHQQAWLSLLVEISKVNSSTPLPIANWLTRWVPHLVQTWQDFCSNSAHELTELEPIFWRQVDTLPQQEMLKHLLRRQQLFSDLGSSEARSDSIQRSELDAAATESAHDSMLDTPIAEQDRLRHWALNTMTDNAQAMTPTDEAAEIYIEQAGLVLLHPFLSAYFREVALVTGDAFTGEQAQQMAIYLLHYLATGKPDAPEYALVLPKLLCGWPLDEPVMRDVPLSAGALTEGEHLLQTVIDHWQALKSTSPDGLREGFLQREGKLIRVETGWKLWVEQRAIDILLDRLPWGLSMVTLPWMEELLTVVWG